MRWVTTRRLLSLALIALAVSGCNILGNDDDKEPNEPVARHRGTPDSLIQYFAQMTADPARDGAEVAKCLHPDFRFYLTEEDRTSNPTLPEYLTRDEFEAAIAAMQDSAVSINLAVSAEGHSETVPCGADSGGVSCQKIPTRVSMVVETHDARYSEVLTLLVNGLSDFYVTADPDDPELWVIHQIYDRTSQLGRFMPVSAGDAATYANTWGAVLNYFSGPLTPRATPQGLVQYFARMTADPNRNVAELATCLHPDCRFFFTEDDRTADPTLPEFFDRASFVASNAGMMSEAVSISMSVIPQHDFGTAPCDPAEPGGAACDSMEVSVSMAVELSPRPPYSGGVLFLIGGAATMTVTPDPADSRLWVVHDIVDRTNLFGRVPRSAAPVASAVEPATWGRLIALFE